MNPAVLRDYKFALTHTPALHGCQIYVSRHSWTPPHNLRFKPPKTTALNGTLETQERFLIW